MTAPAQITPKPRKPATYRDKFVIRAILDELKNTEKDTDWAMKKLFEYFDVYPKSDSN